MNAKEFFKPTLGKVVIFVLLLIGAFWIPYLDLHYWTHLSFNYAVWILNFVIFYIIACIIGYLIKK